MRRKSLSQLLLVALTLVACCGCGQLSALRIPTDNVPSVVPFAGPVTVNHVSIDRFSHIRGPTGFLGLYDLGVIKKWSNSMFSRELSSIKRGLTLNEFWRKEIERRLSASGGFTQGRPVNIDVNLDHIEQLVNKRWLILFTYLFNPIWSLSAGPRCAIEIELDIRITARMRGFEKDYHYTYHEEELQGLYYGGDHTPGRRLGELFDKFVAELATDLGRN